MLPDPKDHRVDLVSVGNTGLSLFYQLDRCPIRAAWLELLPREIKLESSRDKPRIRKISQYFHLSIVCNFIFITLPYFSTRMLE